MAGQRVGRPFRPNPCPPRVVKAKLAVPSTPFVVFAGVLGLRCIPNRPKGTHGAARYRWRVRAL